MISIDNKQLAIGSAALGAVLIISLFSNVTGGLQSRGTESELASTTALLASTTAELSQKTLSLADQVYNLEQKMAEVEDDLQDYRKAVGKISGTVETLEKLSETDPELLQKYSKVYFLNEHYVPPRRREVPKEFVYDENKIIEVHGEVYSYLEDMLEEAKDDGIELYVKSGYRSFAEQTSLKSAYTISYGSGANRFSADQGYSEHQLGTTLDFITTGTNGSLTGFEKTKAYEWMQNNAHKYGFVLSYPEGNAYYMFEPWHWRYVGEKLATYLHRENKHFYDMEQREIDEYLVNLFD